jgi:crotonobetainyl-CoA:carnitine CoA-transferase CaiB-like acyl-CoA transferase
LPSNSRVSNSYSRRKSRASNDGKNASERFKPVRSLNPSPQSQFRKANGVFSELEHPQLGSIPTVNNPLNIEGATKEKPQMAPGVGEHSREILRSLGYEDEAIEELILRGCTIA